MHLHPSTLNIASLNILLDGTQTSICTVDVVVFVTIINIVWFLLVTVAAAFAVGFGGGAGVADVVVGADVIVMLRCVASLGKAGCVQGVTGRR